MLRLTFLGTSAAQPTVDRNLSGIAVKAGGELLLFDCGEGSQRQMIRFGTGFDVDAVFFTHLHADHYLGIIGFVRTLAMMGRERLIQLFGPPGSANVLRTAIGLGLEKQEFPVMFTELANGDSVRRAGCRIRAVEVQHRVSALGYVLEEDARPGPVDLEKANRLGVVKYDLGRLQEGETIELPDGRLVAPSDVLGPDRPGRRIAISGDTRPCEAFAEAARDVDLMVHEATFSDAEQERAHYTQHSTAREAGRIASLANARSLYLTHLSARFSHDSSPLYEQARESFGGHVVIAHDGLVVDVERNE